MKVYNLYIPYPKNECVPIHIGCFDTCLNGMEAYIKCTNDPLLVEYNTDNNNTYIVGNNNLYSCLKAIQEMEHMPERN